MADAPVEPMTTLVFQSFRGRDVSGWIARCLASVEGWAAARGHAYRRFGDEALALAPDWVRAKAGGRLPMVMDVARLLLARELLAEAERVVWFDADVLVFRPDALVLPADVPVAFGRELWVERDRRGRLRAHRNVHNAVCLFARGNSMLDFYIDSALAILGRLEGGAPPQLVGPKLLTALHSIVGFPLIDAVGVLSPAVLEDVVAGGGAALDRLRAAGGAELCAANLCASLVADRPELAEAAVARLLEDPDAALGAPARESH